MIFNMVGGGGGSGATLVVSSPVNVSVTVSKDDKSYTKNSGSLGSTTFKGLATGTWTVTISGNGQTATRTIEITADYARTIAFFSATINITYPANSNCVVTNSGGQTVASDTNTTSSEKTFTATVNATGTYTVTATATDSSGNTKSQSVEITSEGQSESMQLSYALVLFDGENGGDNTAVTGGWLTFHDSNASVNISAEKITMDGGAGYNAAVATKNAVDLSKYSTLFVRYKINSTRGNASDKLMFGVAISSDEIFKQYPSFTASNSLSIETTNDVVVLSCDISSVDTGVVGVNAMYVYNMDVFKIWLE